MIKTILWDNDGVLVDTEELYFEAGRYILSKVGIVLSKEEYIDISLVRGESIFQLALKKGHNESAINELRSDRNNYYVDLLKKKSKVINGVRETLEKLKGNVSMGIVTGSTKEYIDAIHNNSGLKVFFDFVITHDEYTKSKPNPEAYLTAIISRNLNPEECIVVEDSQRGVEAAFAAGIRCLAIPHPLTCKSDFSKAHKILTKVEEVFDFVLQDNKTGKMQ